MSRQSVVCILGPTASGKTGLCLKLFSPSRHVIINTDSQQVYRDLPVGTAQPMTGGGDGVSHRLYGFVAPGGRMSAGEFSELVTVEIRKVEEEGKIPVLSGGSGFYIQSVLYGLDDLPKQDPEIRARLGREAESGGLAGLYEKLRALDPDYAAVISENDKVRIFRALEIHELSGLKLGQLRKTEKKPRFDALVIGIDVPRDLLYRRINERVSAMLDAGWIDETRRVLASGFRDWLLELPAIGYRRVIAYLDGAISREKTIELIGQDTRRYAKRQLTWFRKMKEIVWLPYTREEDVPAIADLLKSRGLL